MLWEFSSSIPISMISIEIASLHYVKIMFPPLRYMRFPRNSKFRPQAECGDRFLCRIAWYYPSILYVVSFTDSCSSKLNSLIIEYRIAIYSVAAFVGVLGTC